MRSLTSDFFLLFSSLLGFRGQGLGGSKLPASIFISLAFSKLSIATPGTFFFAATDTILTIIKLFDYCFSHLCHMKNACYRFSP